MQLPTETGITFQLVYNLLLNHAGIAVLALVLFLIYRYAGHLGLFFKEYLTQKSEVENRKLQEIQKQNDKFFGLYENSTSAVHKVAEAIASFEKAFIGSEARTSEKIVGVESRLSEKISGVENRLGEKILNSRQPSRPFLEKEGVS